MLRSEGTGHQPEARHTAVTTEAAAEVWVVTCSDFHLS